MKTINASPDSRVTEDIVKNLDDVFAFASPREYRDTLTALYHAYILREYKDLPSDFFNQASRIEVLLEFFKNCEGNDGGIIGN